MKKQELIEKIDRMRMNNWEERRVRGNMKKTRKNKARIEELKIQERVLADVFEMTLKLEA